MQWTRHGWMVLSAMAVLAASCQRAPAPPSPPTAAPPAPAEVAPPPPPPAAVPPPPAASPAAGVVERQHLEWLPGPAEGPLAPYLVKELARAKQDNRRLVVYVGATWCEPCRRFHEAAQAGQLDDAFANLRFIEFDLDRDRDRLAADGYASQMIPLIALPGPDGRGNGKGMQGSVKGEGAVANMRPRLQELLAQP